MVQFVEPLDTDRLVATAASQCETAAMRYEADIVVSHAGQPAGRRCAAAMAPLRSKSAGRPRLTTRDSGRQTAATVEPVVESRSVFAKMRERVSGRLVCDQRW